MAVRRPDDVTVEVEIMENKGILNMVDNMQLQEMVSKWTAMYTCC